PEYNAVDASLWYVIATHELLAAKTLSQSDARTLHAAVEAILEGYARGTRYGIRLDDDGLLAAGAPGVQLTWMDAKVGNWGVTPRMGRPVEVQALGLTGLAAASASSERWAGVLARGRETFQARFWCADTGCLYDVVDPNDPAIRPNQIFAVGGLPVPLV